MSRNLSFIVVFAAACATATFGCGSASAPAGLADGPAPTDAAAATDLGAPADGPVADQSSVDLPPASTDAPPTIGDAGPLSAACSSINCPRLFSVASQCEIAGDCSYQAAGMGSNYCYTSGTKAALRSELIGSQLHVSSQYFKSDGTACYSIETAAELTGGDETIVWKDPAGMIIATGVAHPGGAIVVTCDGKDFDVPSMDCPGFRLAAPDPCMAGTCQ